VSAISLPNYLAVQPSSHTTQSIRLHIMAAGKHRQKDDDNWLASLAKRATAVDIGSELSSRNNPPTTTEERVQLRERKRLDREERKRKAAEARLQKMAKKRKRIGNKISELSSSLSSTVKHGDKRKIKIEVGRMTKSSKEALNQLSETFDAVVSDVTKCKSLSNAKSPNKSDGKEQGPEVVNGIPVPKGKATKFSTIRPDSKELQPRIRDYNGQGLVRPSLFLSLADPSFVPKLEMEFAEHIPGFFGRAKAKSAKKQADANMLWRRRMEEKVAENSVVVPKKKKMKKQIYLQEELEARIRGKVM